MDVLRKLFEKRFGAAPESVTPLRGQLGASERKLFRLRHASQNAIGVLYDAREENIAFLEFSRHFRRHGLPVPEIYGDDIKRGAYLEEDLGDLTLYEFLAKHRSGATIAPSSAGSPPTTTSRNSNAPTRSCWTAHLTGTSPSAWDRTDASDRTWRG